MLGQQTWEDSLSPGAVPEPRPRYPGREGGRGSPPGASIGSSEFSVSRRRQAERFHWPLRASRGAGAGLLARGAGPRRADRAGKPGCGPELLPLTAWRLERRLLLTVVPLAHYSIHSILLVLAERLLCAGLWALSVMGLSMHRRCHRSGPAAQCVVIHAVVRQSWALGKLGKIPVPLELRGHGSLLKNVT